MKIEAEKMGERVATEELVRELVRNDARRGEFMIMMDDADEERFVQKGTGTPTLPTAAISFPFAISASCSRSFHWKLDLDLATFPHWQHSPPARANIIRVFISTTQFDSHCLAQRQQQFR